MSPATDCAPKHTLYPTVASTRAVSPPTPAEHHRKRVTVAGFTLRLPAAVSCFVEVTVSYRCCYAVCFALYLPGATGVRSAEAAVRHERKREG